MNERKRINAEREEARQAAAEDLRGHFQLLQPATLVALASGELNAADAAKAELASRGLDVKTGRWVGFSRKRTSEELAASNDPRDQKTLERRLKAESRKLDRKAGRVIKGGR